MSEPKTLIHIVSSNRWSGAERYALDICRHYMDKGWNVMALTRDARAVDSMFRREGIPLEHAPLHGLFDPPSAMALSAILKRIPEGEGVIHVHHYSDAFTALLARKMAGRKDIRVVSTRHRVRKGLDNWLLRRIYRNLDAQIFVSQLAYSRFIATWNGRSLPFPEERVHILANSLNMGAATTTPEPERGPVTAMFHGPLKRGKGLENLIDALPMLRDIKLRLRIVGTGSPDYVDVLRRRAQARKVMEMIDWYKHTDTPMELIASSHFGVLPSVTEEAFGLANIEYMACGRPQVATSSGAQKEYLTDGREALIVPPSDTTALADAIRHLATSPDLRQRMGAAAARRFNSTLCWSRFIARLDKIYG